MFRKVEENKTSMVREIEDRKKTQIRFLEMNNTMCKMKNLTAD